MENDKMKTCELGVSTTLFATCLYICITCIRWTCPEKKKVTKFSKFVSGTNMHHLSQDVGPMECTLNAATWLMVSQWWTYSFGAGLSTWTYRIDLPLDSDAFCWVIVVIPFFFVCWEGSDSGPGQWKPRPSRGCCTLPNWKITAGPPGFCSWLPHNGGSQYDCKRCLYILAKFDVRWRDRCLLFKPPFGLRCRRHRFPHCFDHQTFQVPKMEVLTCKLAPFWVPEMFGDVKVPPCVLLINQDIVGLVLEEFTRAFPASKMNLSCKHGSWNGRLDGQNSAKYFCLKTPCQVGQSMRC